MIPSIAIIVPFRLQKGQNRQNELDTIVPFMIKYLSTLNNSSYNLHEDEIFLNYIKEIKLEKEYIKDNNYELSILFNKKGIQI